MRVHWVWVTRPEFYLDDSGDERADLEPGNQELGEGWWTCHPDTRTGDLVLLYRTAPKSDFAYLFEAASDARVLDDGHDDRFRYALAANPDFSHLDVHEVLDRLRASGFLAGTPQ